jgi:hypothetical protein
MGLIVILPLQGCQSSLNKKSHRSVCMACNRVCHAGMRLPVDAKIPANLIRPELRCGFYGIMDRSTYTIAKASYDMFLKY